LLILPKENLFEKRGTFKIMLIGKLSEVAEFEGRFIYERLSKGKREKSAEGGYIGGWLAL